MRALAVLAVLALAACAKEQPVVNGSSQEAFERTTAAARRELPNDERLRFDRALRTIGGRRHSERDPAALARVTFDGMTAQQVVVDEHAREQ